MAKKADEKPSGLEIPVELRDFADRSVQQARKAVDGLLSAAQKASSMAETSTKTLHENAATLTSQTMQHAQANIKAAFDLAQNLAHATTLQEAVKLQSDFMRSQLESLQIQAKDASEILKSATRKPDKN